MIFLWGSNILRHYLDDHPLLLENLKKVSRQNVLPLAPKRRDRSRRSSQTFVRQWLIISPQHVPDAVRQVVEPNQVHLVAAAVSCDLQQISDGGEPRFTCQIVRDVGDGNLRNRIHDNMALIHLVTTTYLYTRTLPDANAACDSPEPDSHAKAFGEHHIEPHPIATGMISDARATPSPQPVTAAKIPKHSDLVSPI